MASVEHNLLVKERYYKLKQAGICTTCGGRSAIAGQTNCDECARKDRQISVQRTTARKEVGQCVQCRRPAKKDRTQCAEHGKLSAEWSRTHNLKTKLMKFGITEEQYKHLLSTGCFICGAKSNLQLDHDHATEKFRGMLCEAHNLGLGKFSDNPVLLEKAAEYLRRSA